MSLADPPLLEAFRAVGYRHKDSREQSPEIT
jgi:hypothetical protein